MERITHRVFSTLFAMVLISSSCAPRSQDTSSSAGTSQDPLTIEELQNASYFAGLTGAEPFRLVNGRYEDTLQRVQIMLDPRHARGDLNGDGAEDAAMMMISSGGGSGIFVELVPVLNRNGSPEPGQPVLLGDRVRPDTIRIESGEIRIPIVMHDDNDPLCCPTLRAIRSFQVTPDSLAENPMTVEGNLIVTGRALTFAPCGSDEAFRLAGSDSALALLRARQKEANTGEGGVFARLRGVASEAVGPSGREESVLTFTEVLALRPATPEDCPDSAAPPQ